jgi:two-component system, OmpR family, osmolarity sensor histidine kinase EnvZ
MSISLRRIMPRSLMARALLIIIMPLTLTQLLVAYVFYESHWDQVSKQLALGIAGDVALLVDAQSEIDDPKVMAWLFDAARRDMELTATLERDAILPTHGWGLGHYEGELRRALLAKNVNKPFRVDVRHLNEEIAISVQLPLGVLQIVTPRTRLFSWTTSVFVLWMIGSSLIMFGLAAIFMRNQVRPVLRLARVADAFGKGRDVPDFKPEGAREVRLAGLAFVAMRNRIQRQITQRTEMLAGVSHDVRTPLTRMRLELEMMRADDSVKALKQDVAEMERMLEGYLAFARGEGTERPEPCDVGQLLTDAVDQARRSGRDIALTSEGSLAIPLRPNAMKRCLTNLLENAARVARKVVVHAGRSKDAIEVIIDDDGPGIPVDAREKVFKPFYRMDTSRNPGTGGVGLGLTIARDVVRTHGGDITLETSPMGGLRVRLRLPV